MAIDVKKHKKKFLDQKPTINLVPFIDILFTIMIFLVITSNFSATTDVQTDDADPVEDSSGKPNVTDVTDEGQVSIRPGEIMITVPPGVPIDKAVQRPEL